MMTIIQFVPDPSRMAGALRLYADDCNANVRRRAYARRHR